MNLSLRSFLRKNPIFQSLNASRAYYKYFVFRNPHYNDIPEIMCPNGIIFMLAPDYSNLGDVAIYSATMEFFKDNGIPVKAVLLSRQCANKKTLKKCILNNDIIVLQGGGNLGTLYQTEEMLRQNIIKWFKGNKIVSFPQSVYFDPQKKSFIGKSAKAYCSHENLTVCVRDKVSRDFSSSVLKANAVLLPDMVLSKEPKRKNEYIKNNKVLFCVRHDFEKGKTASDLERFQEYLISIGFSIDFFDTDDGSGKNIPDKKKSIDTLLEYFGSFQLVVTDRFHGTVFSYITKTPCIAFDNSYRKISNAFFWYEKSNYMFFADSFDGAVNALNQVERLDDFFVSKDICPKFSELVKIMGLFVKGANPINQEDLEREGKKQSVNPLISVIIPCYNAEQFVEEAVRSVMSQSYTNLEILCCDDCSTDKTLVILERLAKEDSRIKILHNETNLKLIDTLNKLVSVSTGTYIARMDADDVSLPGRIARQLAFMMQNPQIDFCGCNAFHINENGKIIGKSTLPESYEDVKFFLPYYSTFYHPTVFFRAEVLKENPYSKDFIHAEDYELWCRLIFEKGMKGANLRERLFKYRMNSQGVSQQNIKKQNESSAKALDKHSIVQPEFVELHKNIFFTHLSGIAARDRLYLKNVKKELTMKRYRNSYMAYGKILFHLKVFKQWNLFVSMASCPLGCFSLFKILNRRIMRNK